MNGNPNDLGTNPDNFLPTRRTLISRLRDWEDKESWEEFFETYWRLIFSVALKAGLTNTEAEEVVQETVISVAKKMDSFQYDPERCSFKGWLRHVTRLRILDQFRKRKPDFYRGDFRRDEERDGTATVDRIIDPSDDLEHIWDREWDLHIVEITMARVKPKISAEHFQLFYMSVIENRSCRDVARLLGTTAAQVYVVRHRVRKLAEQERKALEKEQAAALNRRESPKPAGFSHSNQ